LHSVDLTVLEGFDVLDDDVVVLEFWARCSEAVSHVLTSVENDDFAINIFTTVEQQI